MTPSAKSGTLAPNVVTSVVVGSGYPGVTVLNRSQTGEIWVRLDGTDPVVAADDTFVVLGARYFDTSLPHVSPVTVKLISIAALNYSVEGNPGGRS